MTRVREARTDDGPRLRAIQSAALAQPVPDLLELGVDSGGPTVLVAERESERVPDDDGTARPDRRADAGGPVGYALAVTDADERVGYLVELAVAANARGEGHGTALLSTLVERFREDGVDRLRVTVRAVDERAREFYRSRGFDERTRLPEHYEDCDGLLLVCELR